MSAQSKVLIPASTNVAISSMAPSRSTGPWPPASCQPPLMIGNTCHFRMAKCADTRARNAEERAAVRIGTGDVGIGGHPVRGVSHPLFGGKDRQQCCQRVDRKRLAIRKAQIFSG